MIEDNPIHAKAKYTPIDGDPMLDSSLYRTIMGSLVYLIVTHPEISYVVHFVSHFVSAPTMVYWDAVLQILRYFWGTQVQTILFSSTSALNLHAYCDSIGLVIRLLASHLLDMGVPISHFTPSHCDNRSAI
ncbi:uncharacterized mitochondrial protein-like protein [Tanacetum coccineum]